MRDASDERTVGLETKTNTTEQKWTKGYARLELELKQQQASLQSFQPLSPTPVPLTYHPLYPMYSVVVVIVLFLIWGLVLNSSSLAPRRCPLPLLFLLHPFSPVGWLQKPSTETHVHTNHVSGFFSSTNRPTYRPSPPSRVVGPILRHRTNESPSPLPI